MYQTAPAGLSTVMTGSGTSNSSRDGISLTVSASRTYWTQRIAEEVTQRGGDVHLYTSEPRFLRSSSYEVAEVNTILHPFLITQIGFQIPALNRLLGFTGYNRPFERWGAYQFDRAVSKCLDHTANAIFLGFAGGCRDSLRRANELGYATAVERSSTHIRTQRRILREEHERFGIPNQPVSKKHVQREETEYEEADYIITPSEFTCRTFRDHGIDDEKLVKIPFGTDVSFEPPARNSSDDTFTLLYAGHVSLRKGIQYLLPAWEELSLPNAELIVAGNIDESISGILDDYKDNPTIHFEGWVEDMNELFKEASAFVLPSLEEGSARVLYEAMAWELPVITTSNSGWVGTDGKHGIEVPLRNTSALTSAIDRIYSNKKTRRRMGSEGRVLIESEYTWDDYGDRIWNVYQMMSGR